MALFLSQQTSMSVTRIPVDGLWRCLCPSFDRLPLVPVRGLRAKNVRRVRVRAVGGGGTREFHTGVRKEWGLGSWWKGDGEVVKPDNTSGKPVEYAAKEKIEEGRHTVEPPKNPPTENDEKERSHDDEAIKRDARPPEPKPRQTERVFVRKIPYHEAQPTKVQQKWQPGYRDNTRYNAARQEWLDRREVKQQTNTSAIRGWVNSGRKDVRSLPETTTRSKEKRQVQDRENGYGLKKEDDVQEKRGLGDSSAQSLSGENVKAEDSFFSFSQAFAQDMRQVEIPQQSSTTPSPEIIGWRTGLDEFYQKAEAPSSAEDSAELRSEGSGDVKKDAAKETVGNQETETDQPSMPSRSWIDAPQDQPSEAVESHPSLRSTPIDEELADVKSFPEAPLIDSSSPEWSRIPSRKPSTDQAPADLPSTEIHVGPQQPPSPTSNQPTSWILDNESAISQEDIRSPTKLPSENSTWDDVPLIRLHDQLRTLTMTKNAYAKICDLVTYLVHVRRETPALIHYDALIRANADAECGSADIVRHLLQEMQEMGIGGDSGLYHGVLQVLAIHPDYLLRDQVLQEMKIRWFGLSPEGWHNYVTGLIRDRQYEAAMDKLEQMQSDGIIVQRWLYDILMFQLCDAGELDEVFRLLRYRHEHHRTGIETSLWYYVLDAFTKAYHYEGTTFIWKKRVETNDIVPSDGICTATLNMAARYANSELATSCVRILSSRLPVLTMHHYEALLAAYIGADDIKTAFRVLAIMSKAQIEPDKNTTRPIFIHLSQSIDHCHFAWEDLKSLSADGHTIPVAAANVILESTNEVGHFDQAVTFYKQLHEIIETGPDVETFNTLLQGAHYASRKDLCMFLASEMSVLDVRPNQLTYDRLILACLKEEDYEDAFRYLEEVIVVGEREGWWMRFGTASELVKRCAVAGDERAWEIYNGMLDRGMDVKESWITDRWPKRKEESQSSARYAQFEGFY